MKQTLLVLILFCLVGCNAYGQYPRGGFDNSKIIIPPTPIYKDFIKTFEDTIQANGTGINKIPGIIIGINCDSLSMYYRNQTCDKWIFITNMYIRKNNPQFHHYQ